MKISGKFILKVAGTLTVIALVVAALLGLVNSITAGKIAEIDAENTRIAMSAVVPEGSEFTDKLEISDDVAAAAAAQGGKLTELYGVKNAGADAGYVMKIAASGSQGTITMMVGVDMEGKVTGVSIISHSETAGLGAVAAAKTAKGQAFRDQFIGQSGSPAVTKDGGNIDAIASATITSRAVTEGVSTALALVRDNS